MNRTLEAMRAEIGADRMQIGLPCIPDRTRGDLEEIQKLHSMLAECYKLTGADPDGNEDWRLAPRAVEEVRRMRGELDDAEDQILELSEQLDGG